MMLPAVVGAASTVVEVLYDDDIKGFPGESPKNLFDNDPDTKWCANLDGKKAEILFDIGRGITAKGYVLTTGNDAGEYRGRAPELFVLYGYNETSGKFVKLDEITDRTIIADKNAASFTFSIDKEVRGLYRKYKIEATHDELIMLADFCLVEEEVTDSVHVCEPNYNEVYFYYDNAHEHIHTCATSVYCDNLFLHPHVFTEWERDGYKNVRYCEHCFYSETTALTQGQEAVDNIKNVMKTLALRKFAVAIDCDEDAVVITNNTNTKKVIDDLGDSALYNFMADVKYSFAAAEGYEIVSVTVDGVEVDADNVLIYQIRGNHVIKVVTEKIAAEEAADTAIAE